MTLFIDFSDIFPFPPHIIFIFSLCSRVKEYEYNVRGERKDIRKFQEEILKMKNTVSEVKYSVGGIKSRLDNCISKDQ